jgi:hypothetical protein
MSTDSKLRAQHPRLATYDMLAVKHLWDSHVNLTGLSLSLIPSSSLLLARGHVRLCFSLCIRLSCVVCAVQVFIDSA